MALQNKFEDFYSRFDGQKIQAILISNSFRENFLLES